MIMNYFRELAQTISTNWTQFWFTPRRAETLGVIRILTGLMLVYTHLVWALELVSFFGESGQLPYEFVRQMQARIPEWHTSFAWSYLYGVTSPGMLGILHACAMVILVLFTLGCWTRLTSVLAFLITVAYANRGMGALFGLDQINTLLALYLAIGNCGDAYSIDAWRKTRRLNLRNAPSTVSTNIAIRLIQCHMCLIYLFAGLGKLLGASWWEGTALWGAFANLEYQTIDMTWLSLYPQAVNFLTHLTVAWEVSYIVLVWPRITRPLVIALAIPLHLGIALCMGMITFGLIMLVGNLAFVSSSLVATLIGRILPRKLNENSDHSQQGRAVAEAT